MGLLRIITRSSRFAMRVKRRFIPFLLLYAFIAASIGFMVNTLDNYQTENYIDQRGVFIEELTDMSVTGFQGQNLVNNLTAQDLGFPLDKIGVFKYAVLDPTLRIYSIDTSRPWLHPYINPDVVVSGSFPRGQNQAIIPRNDLQTRVSSNNVNIESTIAVGSEFTFNNGNDTIKVSVTGLFDPSNYVGARNPDLWLFVDTKTFDNILQLYSMDPTNDTYVHSMSIPVKIEGSGIPLFDVPSETDYQNVADLENIIESSYLSNPADFGTYDPNAKTTALDVKRNNRAQDLIQLGLAAGGGVLVVLLVGILLSRFRKREIAILKAMGYSRGHIQLSLITDIFTDAVSGFIVGIGGVQIALLATANFNLAVILRWSSILISFLIVVVISLPGAIFVSWRGLSVSPMTIFRDK